MNGNVMSAIFPSQHPCLLSFVVAMTTGNWDYSIGA